MKLRIEEPEEFAACAGAGVQGLVPDLADFWKRYLVAARERGEIHPDTDIDEASEWVARVLLSLATVPGDTLDAERPSPGPDACAALRHAGAAGRSRGIARTPSRRRIAQIPADFNNQMQQWISVVNTAVPNADGATVSPTAGPPPATRAPPAQPQDLPDLDHPYLPVAHVANTAAAQPEAPKPRRVVP